jgi:hypothetical protein
MAEQYSKHGAVLEVCYSGCTTVADSQWCWWAQGRGDVVDVVEMPSIGGGFKSVVIRIQLWMR